MIELNSGHRDIDLTLRTLYIYLSTHLAVREINSAAASTTAAAAATQFWSHLGDTGSISMISVLLGLELGRVPWNSWHWKAPSNRVAAIYQQILPSNMCCVIAGEKQYRVGDMHRFRTRPQQRSHQSDYCGGSFSLRFLD